MTRVRYRKRVAVRDLKVKVPSADFVWRNVCVGRKVMVEIRNVMRTVDGRLDWRGHRLLRQAVPVKALEEPVTTKGSTVLLSSRLLSRYTHHISHMYITYNFTIAHNNIVLSSIKCMSYL